MLHIMQAQPHKSCFVSLGLRLDDDRTERFISKVEASSEKGQIKVRKYLAESISMDALEQMMKDDLVTAWNEYCAEYGPFEDDGFDELAVLNTSDTEKVPVAQDSNYPYYGS